MTVALRRTAGESRAEPHEKNNARVVVALILLLLIIPSTFAWSEGWSYRRNIIIDVSQVNGTHTNFPLLVRITNDTNIAANALSSGNDILFTNTTDGKLDHEIERYNSTTGELIAWVRIPSLTNSSNTTIYLYYGNSGAANQQNRTGVWDSGYKMVQHMFNNGSLNASDSTSNRNNGTANSTGQGQGMIGAAANFTGGQVDSDSLAAYLQTGNVTFSAWINLPTHYNTTSTAMEIMRLGDSPSDNDIEFSLGRPYDNSKPGQLDIAHYTGAATVGASSGKTVWLANTWYYIVGTFSTQTGSQVFVDGALNGTEADTTRGSSTPAQYFQTGIRGQAPAAPTGAFTGLIDETRVSTTVRSAQWIQTEYNNQKVGSSTLSIGAVENPWYSAYWQYRKNITIVASQVNGTHTNFPLLVRIANDTNLAAGALSSDNDLLFTSMSGAKLDHEIEKYNGTSGELVAWVRIPSLTNASNTTLYLYYGNPNATNQQNVTGVWDSLYLAVYHMNDTLNSSANLSVRDAKNVNNATGNGTWTPSQTVDGLLGRGLNFTSANSGYVLTPSLGTPAPTSITIEAWVKPNASGGIVFTEQGNLPVNSGWHESHVEVETNGVVYSCIWTGGLSCVMDTPNINFSQWSHVVMRYNASTSILSGFHNGLANSSSLTKQYPGTLWYAIGSSDTTNNGNGAFFTGQIDEVRITNGTRTNEWIQTEYNNQKSDSTMISVSSQTSYWSSWTNNQSITIDHTQVNGTHSNFPLLVRISSHSTLAANAQSDAEDIAFADSNGSKLDHEIEQYNSTTGELVAWVRMPILSNVTDTTATMYYGNPSATNQQNVTGVWDVNYTGIWHLGETAGTNSVDATNHNNGTRPSGTSPRPDPSILGYGQSFNGTTDLIYATDTAVLQANAIQTVSFWTLPRSTNSSGVAHRIVAETQDANNYWAVNLGDPGVGSLTATFGIGGVVTAATSPASIIPIDGTATQYYYATVVFNGTAVTGIYLNGASQSVGGIGNLPAGSTTNFSIGARPDAARFYNGTIDEVRLSNAPRSAQWIQTEYNNQRSNSTMVSVSGIASCAPTNGQTWVLNASAQCTVSFANVNVTTWTISGSGQVVINNSNITYRNMTYSGVTGPLAVRLIEGARVRGSQW